MEAPPWSTEGVLESHLPRRLRHTRRFQGGRQIEWQQASHNAGPRGSPVNHPGSLRVITSLPDRRAPLEVNTPQEPFFCPRRIIFAKPLAALRFLLRETTNDQTI